MQLPLLWDGVDRWSTPKSLGPIAGLHEYFPFCSLALYQCQQEFDIDAKLFKSLARKGCSGATTEG